MGIESQSALYVGQLNACSEVRYDHVLSRLLFRFATKGSIPAAALCPTRRVWYVAVPSSRLLRARSTTRHRVLLPARLASLCPASSRRTMQRPDLTREHSSH